MARGRVANPHAFGCGHPRTEANSRRRRNGTPANECAFCYRVRKIVQQVDRGQMLINSGEMRRFERMAVAR